MRHQAGRTKDAVLGLVKAHVDLAKAELGEIVDEIKHVAILASIALSLVLFAGILLPVGFFLWLGESLFGSLGWGALIGSELLLAVAVLILLPVLGNGVPAIRTFILALIVSAVIAAVLGSNITNTAWDRLGEAISPNLAPSTRPLVVAAVAGAIVFAVIGLIAGATAGGAGGAIGGLIGGGIFGALLGASTAITYSWHVAIAIGLTFLFVLWPLFAALAVVRHGIDTEQLKDRFWPDQTIATSKETIEWVRAQTPLARKS